MPKRTYKPSNVRRNRKLGFRERMSRKLGQILKRQRAKGRHHIGIKTK